MLSTKESLSSPEYLRLSLAAALVLRAASGRFYREVQLHCVNLLLTYPEGCRANCAYCGLARRRRVTGETRSFIRVDWPVLPTEELIDRIVRHQHSVKRVCLSMVTHRAAYRDTVTIAGKILERVDVPLSVLVAPHVVDAGKLRELRQIGADIIGIGLDAASPRVFERTRGRGTGSSLSWQRYWDCLEISREIFGPFQVNAHLIVGIGETDRELVEMFCRLREMQVCAYLFCFYPEDGSLMQRRKRPTLKRFRRLQLVKYLLENKGVEKEQIRFDPAGGIQYLDVPPSVVEETLLRGEPFLTGGCPDREGKLVCTRPFGSYRPGESFRDFPFLPERKDLERVRRELRLEGLLPC